MSDKKTSMTLDDETARVSPSEVEEGALMLLVVGPGGGVAHSLPERGTVLIGRSVEAQIQIDEPSISRRHAEIVMGQSPFIRDLGSANGVRVGQKLVAKDSVAAIELGQVIELGNVVAVVHRATMLASPSATTAPASGEERPSLTPGGPAVVRDAVMQRLYAMVDRIAPSDLSVLLLGETGVGKEVVAEAIHRASRRAEGPYVKLNCSALTEALVESELFGHVRGAFTGAVRDKEGLLESAQGGTVFLDEIGELSPAIQAKLLRVLEERKVTRVGSVTPHAIDVRFVAATNRDLKAEAELGRFRSDLYFRLNGISLLIPPLRDRPSEIEPLARRFAAGSSPDTPRVEIGADAAACLARYAWPGNVRELRNAMERATVLAGPGPITAEHLPPEIAEAAPSRSPTPTASASDVSDDASLQAQMEALERRRIVEALEQCDGNQTKAAELLGMPRRTFVKRLDAYGIDRPRKK